MANFQKLILPEERKFEYQFENHLKDLLVPGIATLKRCILARDFSRNSTTPIQRENSISSSFPYPNDVTKQFSELIKCASQTNTFGDKVLHFIRENETNLEDLPRNMRQLKNYETKSLPDQASSIIFLLIIDTNSYSSFKYKYLESLMSTSSLIQRFLKLSKI
jgi:hypothetical protein